MWAMLMTANISGNYNQTVCGVFLYAIPIGFD
jgi:hypothetical protein